MVCSPWNINNRLVCLCGQLGVLLALPACGVLIAKGHSHADQCPRRAAGTARPSPPFASASPPRLGSLDSPRVREVSLPAAEGPVPPWKGEPCGGPSNLVLY